MTEKHTHERFHVKSLDQLKGLMAELDLHNIPVVDSGFDALTTPVDVAGKILPHRFTVHPMEGFDADPQGSPGPLAFRRYRRYAEGGAALIWCEATAVRHEARSNPGQFYIHAGNVANFAKLVSDTKAAGRAAMGFEPVMILQLTHSGRYSKPGGVPEPIIAHRSPILDPKHNLPEDYPVVTDDYLDGLQDTFVEAANLAKQAGFDGVDIKSCHRYLFSELLASHTREGKYGGSLENRTRMLREIYAKIREGQPELIVSTRVNVFDAIPYPYGFGVDKDDHLKPDLSEPLELIRELRNMGLPLLNISIGNPYSNPHVGRPYDWPIKTMPPPPEHPLFGVDRFFGIIRDVQQANADLPVIATGFAWLRQFMPNVAAPMIENGWATLIGQGRGSFAYPDAVRDILENGRMQPDKCCVTCSACTQIMRDGGKTGCVVHDSKIYGPQYRLARRYSLDRLLDEVEHCRQCEEAACARGCPAHIDIPAFLKAFADQDIARAYDILREKNPLPEMCGYVCPASDQCQGACLENIFCEHPVPIQDIQLFVARAARLQGLAGVRLPENTSGRSLAVVGGGPAGIAAAIKALENGDTVTIIEKNDRLGGVPDTTIPEERYGDAEAEVEAIFKPALDAGRLDVRCNTVFGRDVTLDELREQFDAVLIGLGLTGSTSLTKGETVPGVENALEFLAAAKRGDIESVPQRVAVLGGGNTAMDAASTAKHLGARDVYIVYRRSFQEMPAWDAERNECLDAGVHFLVLNQPMGYETDENGRVCGVRIARTELGEPDASGRRRPLVLEETENTLAVDMVIEAIGQNVPQKMKDALPGIEFTDRGLIQVDPETGRTSLENVFAAGDMVNGGATAVEAIAEALL